jgi:AraC-like DNA-binding protein
MQALVDLLTAAVSGSQVGAGATLPALLDLVLVHVLRQWHEQHGAAGWPQTSDPAIAAALREIHEDPQRNWTVGLMSEAAGMPRTAFTRRFSAVVGQPPMSYLIGWRLARGAQLLRETDAPLASIARQVGYSTEFAFSVRSAASTGCHRAASAVPRQPSASPAAPRRGAEHPARRASLRVSWLAQTIPRQLACIDTS